MKRDKLTDEPPLQAVGLYLVIVLVTIAALWLIFQYLVGAWHRDSAELARAAVALQAAAHQEPGAAWADPIPFVVVTPPPDRRPAIAKYIAGVPVKHGHGPDPRQAANQLVWLEDCAGGAKAELMAAVVTRESGWDSRARNRTSGALGLCQILPSTARSVYGKLPESWGENLYMGSTYLQGCIDAELNARHPEPVRAGLSRYNGGPGKPAAAWGYAKRVLNERAKLP